MKTHYTINRRLWCHLLHNIKSSPSFRKDIVKGLIQKDGKLYLTQVGVNTCSNFNLPGTELVEEVEI